MRWILFAALLFFPPAVSAEILWDNGSLRHRKADGIDELTALVHLERGDERGIFNPVSELTWVAGTSPADTRWAFEGLLGNPAGVQFTASEFASLFFTDFAAALGGQVGNNIIGRPGVVHLIEEDVYVEIEFDTWTNAFRGADFAYTRATGPSTVVSVPSSSRPGVIMLVLGLLVIGKACGHSARNAAIGKAASMGSTA